MLTVVVEIKQLSAHQHHRALTNGICHFQLPTDDLVVDAGPALEATFRHCVVDFGAVEEILSHISLSMYPRTSYILPSQADLNPQRRMTTISTSRLSFGFGNLTWVGAVVPCADSQSKSSFSEEEIGDPPQVTPLQLEPGLLMTL